MFNGYQIYYLRGVGMKKILMMLLTGVLSFSVLVACGNDEVERTQEDPVTEEVEDTEEVAKNNNEKSTDSNDSDIEIPEGPQTDLRIGDTAIVQSTLGLYELTLNSAELIGTELDGEEALLDELIVLHFTYKNIGEKSFKGEHEMINFGISTEPGAYQNTNAAASFDSIEFFEGDVEPGETREAEFIADTYTADEYYFETGSGAIASGAYSEIRWTFTAKEAGRD